MTDREMLEFVVALTHHAAELLRSNGRPSSQTETAAPPLEQSIPWMDEGFARWMGCRGQEEQEIEIAWDREEVHQARQESRERRRRDRLKEIHELRQFVYGLKEQIERFCSRSPMV